MAGGGGSTTAGADIRAEGEITAAAPSGLAALDSCGNTALHVAVLRGHVRVVDALLDDDVDFPLDVRSSTGWTPLQEAVHLGDRRLVKTLFKKQIDRSKRDFERKKPVLLATLRSLPDFRMKIHWEFGSMVFGPMLRRYAPSDTYEVTKRGEVVSRVFPGGFPMLSRNTTYESGLTFSSLLFFLFQ